MTVLVRHASAGDSSAWVGDDTMRPLDERGRRQAAGLLDLLADHEVDRIVSSPYLRCLQTVEPLSRARGLEIEQAYADVDAARLDRPTSARLPPEGVQRSRGRRPSRNRATVGGVRD